ncbi:MAG: IPTL-CTERM sorting domain-containing protein [Burkholderiaceae bacterium]|nr:IPTL-CTERM sorting domain-containing protein [Burkholderiaceae bacterium]
MAELLDALKDRSDLAIVIFSESCTTCEENLKGFMAGVNAIQPTDWSPAIALGPATTANYTAPLNKASLYASTFENAGLGALVAGNYTPIINVPLNYALYTQSALPSSPPGMIGATCGVNTSDCAVGLFIPQTASNNGQGACLFLTADASEFLDSHPTQYAPIATAFTAAALDPNGACAQPVAGAPDLTVKLTQLDDLIPSNPTRIELTVTNIDEPGVIASANGKVTVTLAADIHLLSLPAGCNSAGSASFTCNLSALNPGNNLTSEFTIQVLGSISNAPIEATVTDVPNEINLGNNGDTMLLSYSEPDLAVTLTGQTPGDPLALSVGAAATITVTVTNISATSSTGGKAVLSLPADLELSGALPAGCSLTAPAATTTGPVVTCTLPNLDGVGGAVNAVQFPLQIIAPAPILTDTPIEVKISDVTSDTNRANDQDTLHVHTSGSPDLTVELGGPGVLSLNTVTAMTVTASNSGVPGVVASPPDALLVVTLPDGLELLSPPAGCTSTTTTTQASFTCLVGALQPGASTSPLTYQVRTTDPALNAIIEAEITWPARAGATASSRASMNVRASSNSSGITAVPTLSELTLMLLALILAGGAAARLRRS